MSSMVRLPYEVSDRYSSTADFYRQGGASTIPFEYIEPNLSILPMFDATRKNKFALYQISGDWMRYMKSDLRDVFCYVDTRNKPQEDAELPTINMINSATKREVPFPDVRKVTKTVPQTTIPSGTLDIVREENPDLALIRSLDAPDTGPVIEAQNAIREIAQARYRYKNEATPLQHIATHDIDEYIKYIDVYGLKEFMTNHKVAMTDYQYCTVFARLMPNGNNYMFSNDDIRAIKGKRWFEDVYMKYSADPEKYERMAKPNTIYPYLLKFQELRFANFFIFVSFSFVVSMIGASLIMLFS